MRVIWEIEDGYAGKHRPQETVIDDEDLEGLDEQERQEYIYECVQEDFEATISWFISYTEDD